MIVRVVDLHQGGRLRLWRPGQLMMVHFDVVRLDQFAEGGSCLPLLISESVTLRDALDDLLGLTQPRPNPNNPAMEPSQR